MYLHIFKYAYLKKSHSGERIMENKNFFNSSTRMIADTLKFNKNCEGWGRKYYHHLDDGITYEQFTKCSQKVLVLI